MKPPGAQRWRLYVVATRASCFSNLQDRARHHLNEGLRRVCSYQIRHDGRPVLEALNQCRGGRMNWKRVAPA